MNFKSSNFTILGSYFNADRIWMQNLFQDCSWIFLKFFLVLRKNCFSEPDDMYSVMKITWKPTNKLGSSRPEESLAVARCEAQGCRFDSQKGGSLFTFFNQALIIFYNMPILMPGLYSNHLYEVAVHHDCSTFVISLQKSRPRANT